MKILFFCPRWGQESLPWDVFLEQVKQAGYDGLECGLPASAEERDEMLTGIAKHGLRYIGQHWETVEHDFGRHHEEYERRLKGLVDASPMFVNSQTGKDYYSFDNNATLLATADHIAKASGIPVIHETHRGKFSFAAHIMQAYLERLPDIKITLDISHWCAVAETLLHDQPGAVETAIAHTEHIHARIGHTQGPQVMDPRAPENKEALDFHLQCWDRVVERKKSSGSEWLTVTPEFGAPPYLPLFPYTKQPIVSQWEVNLFMMDLLKKRYA